MFTRYVFHELQPMSGPSANAVDVKAMIAKSVLTIFIRTSVFGVAIFAQVASRAFVEFVAAFGTDGSYHPQQA